MAIITLACVTDSPNSFLNNGANPEMMPQLAKATAKAIVARNRFWLAGDRSAVFIYTDKDTQNMMSLNYDPKMGWISNVYPIFRNIDANSAYQLLDKVRYCYLLPIDAVTVAIVGDSLSETLRERLLAVVTFF